MVDERTLVADIKSYIDGLDKNLKYLQNLNLLTLLKNKVDRH